MAHRRQLLHASARHGYPMTAPWICQSCLLISWSPRAPQTDVVIVCTHGSLTRGRARSMEVVHVPSVVDLFGYDNATLYYVAD